MGSKAEALHELEAVIREFAIPASRAGRDISGDPSFMARMRDPKKNISTSTLDAVLRYVLRVRGQIDLDLKP